MQCFTQMQYIWKNIPYSDCPKYSTFHAPIKSEFNREILNERNK